MNISVMAVLLLFTLLIISNVNVLAQEGNKQDNDLIFEVQGLKTTPTTKDFQITGEVWKKICPSNQCQIKEDEYSNITMPDVNDASPHVLITLNFYVHNNTTNRDLTPAQKNIIERYNLTVSCIVNNPEDIIGQSSNIIYKCSNEGGDLQKYDREEKDSIYYFKIDGTYDTQSDTLKATGKFDR